MDVREKLEVIAHLGDHITYKEDIGICYDSALAKVIEDSYMELKNGATVQEWISVKDRLPKENEYVMIWCGECQIARIEKGISEEQRKAMKRGELDDPCETGWTLSSGYFTLKRSQSYKACDEQGNNRVPYCWYANGGPMKWFGQEVTHWAYLPQPPKGE